MSLPDPAERTRTGMRRQTELLGAPAPEPGTLLEASWRDYVFAEVWTRPGLARSQQSGRSTDDGRAVASGP